MLTITRKSDNRIVKCILHRVADIPGGVTVKVAEMGGSALYEGTPLAKGADGLYRVVKTAQIITEATADATQYDVAKGHHFKVGDYFATATCKGQQITAIDKSNAAKDIITVGATLGAKITAGSCAYEAAGNNTTLKYTPVAIAGTNHDVASDTNLFVDAWVIGVVYENNAPIVNDAIKSALTCVKYI